MAATRGKGGRSQERPKADTTAEFCSLSPCDALISIDVVTSVVCGLVEINLGRGSDPDPFSHDSLCCFKNSTFKVSRTLAPNVLPFVPSLSAVNSLALAALLRHCLVLFAFQPHAGEFEPHLSALVEQGGITILIL